MIDYDAFADIYDAWVATAPVAERNLPFYVEEYMRTACPVVEMGVGNGRILIEAARRGKPVVGVDSSAEMLALCRQRAEAAGVADLLTLIQADFREVVLPEPAELVTIPFHTIGHLVTLEDKRAGLRNILGQLAPGGRLVFDIFVFNPTYARERNDVVGLRAEFTDERTGRESLLWAHTRYDFETQAMRVIAWTDEMDERGEVVRRKYRRVGFSWIEPEQMRGLLEETGFEIEALYGDFDRRPFAEDSPEQVWVARKPRTAPG
jgi:SAM-dependent methyltransferase